MKIRTQQLISSYVSVGLVVIVATTLLYASREVTKAIQRANFSANVLIGVSQLRFVMSEYLQYHHERPKLQWQRRYESNARLLESDAYDGTPDAEIVDYIRERHKQLQDAFTRAVENYESSAGDAPAAALSQDLENKLASQLRETAQAIMSDASRLVQASHERLAQTQDRASLIVMFAVAIVAIVVIGNMLLATRNILRPIQTLRTGMAHIAEGKFDVGTAIDADNEIGDLSRGFETMAARVQSSHAALVQKADQLVEANKELESFSYSVSHDLRAPLRAIEGFSHRLAEGYADRLDTTAMHYLTRIRSGTQVMSQLIEDLLNLSRVSRAELRLERVDFGALANRVMKELQLTEVKRRVEFVIGDAPIVRGDQRLLEVVLRNLFENALKFTSKQDHPRVELTSHRRGNELVHCVADNGAGFDMAYADKLFVPFQRLHTVREFPGTGIGLVIVRRIVQRHGGEIWAEAAVGEGAKFYFTLPEEKRDGETADTAGGRQPGRRGAHTAVAA